MRHLTFKHQALIAVIAIILALGLAWQRRSSASVSEQVTLIPGSASSAPAGLSAPISRASAPQGPGSAPINGRQMDARAKRLLTEANVYAPISELLAEGKGGAHHLILEVLYTCGSLETLRQKGQPLTSPAALAASPKSALAADKLAVRCASLPPHALDFFDAATTLSNRNSPGSKAARRGSFKVSDLPELLSVYDPHAVEIAFEDFSRDASDKKGVDFDLRNRMASGAGLAAAMAMCKIGYDQCDSPDDFRVLSLCQRKGACHDSYWALLQSQLDALMPLPKPSMAEERRKFQAKMVSDIQELLARHW